MFPDSVSLYARTSITTAGVATYGTAVTSRASVQAARVIVTSGEGMQARTDGARIFLPGAIAVDNGAKIVHGSTTYEVVGVAPFNDPGKPSFREVYARLI